MTGLRQGECLGLTWDRVDLAAGVIDVEWQLQRVNLSAPEGPDLTRLSGQWCLVPPKAARSRRRVPIIPPLLEVLRRYRDVAPRNPWGLLWTQPSGLPLTSNLDREAWYAALDRAGLPRVVIHATRHTAITIMQALGVPEDVRLAAVGQSTVAVHRAYAHTSLDTMRAEMTKMTALMPGSGGTNSSALPRDTPGACQ
jgi:integrase